MSNITIDPSILTTATNKTVLITGAARGIGAATAKQFNAHGANVVLADLAQFRSIAEQFIQQDLADPSRATFVEGNIVNWDELRNCFKKTVEIFGGIDIVVANAGIMESRSVLDFEVDEDGELKEDEEAKRVFDVNLRGTLNTLRLALFYLSQSPSPPSSKSVILVGSSSSYFGGTGVTAYVASKHGVLGLLRAAQGKGRELGIRINGIAPFLTPTHITAGFTHRWRERGLEENTPERVAEAIAFVALDEGRNGDCLLVAGKFLRELESSRAKLIPTWLGEDVAQFLSTAMQFFVSIGGYVLPKKY
ncbi:unnamed protein product [Penicillium pancosmium]